MKYATRSLNHSTHNYYSFYVTLQSRVTVGKGLTGCKVGVFSREISQLPKYAYPFFEKPLKFIAHGHTFHIRVFPISFRIKKPLEAYYDSDNIISHYQSRMTNLGVFAELSYM